MSRLLLLAAACAVALPASSAAQEATPAPPARAADVASIDAIMRAVYDAISGPAGPRDWDRFRSLFAPGARLIPTGRRPDGTWAPNVLTVDQYIERVGSYFGENPFFEDELHRVTEEYGHIAHVFSSYVSRRAPGAEPFSRGINSFQLFWDGTRWWVVSIFWDAERDGQPIPERYLPGGR